MIFVDEKLKEKTKQLNLKMRNNYKERKSEHSIV